MTAVNTPYRGCFTAVLLSVACTPAPDVPAPPPLSWTTLAAAADPVPMELELPPAPPSSRRPLSWLHHACRDRRFPTLAGPWAVGCGPGGRVDRAIHLETGQRVELGAAADSAAAGPGWVFAPGAEHGWWALPSPTPRSPWPAHAAPIGQPVIDGRHAALSLEGRIAAFELGESHTLSRDADPTPWFPPALAWPTVYWVDSRDQAVSGLDIWAWDTTGGPPLPLVTRAGDQRHVAASRDRLVWLDEQGLWLHDLSDDTRWLHRTDTGFRAGPSVDGSVACWEERKAGDVDVRCTDGLEATGAGDQGWPSRWGPWLMVRVDGTPWLITAQAAQVESP